VYVCISINSHLVRGIALRAPHSEDGLDGHLEVRERHLEEGRGHARPLRLKRKRNTEAGAGWGGDVACIIHMCMYVYMYMYIYIYIYICMLLISACPQTADGGGYTHL